MRISVKISRESRRPPARRGALTSSLNYNASNDEDGVVVVVVAMGSRPIHFHNEINKIAILNLGKILTPVGRGRRRRRLGRRRHQLVYEAEGCVRRRRRAALLGSIWRRRVGRATGRARSPSPNRLMGLQLSAAAAAVVDSGAELRPFCPAASSGPDGRNAAG